MKHVDSQNLNKQKISSIIFPGDFCLKKGFLMIGEKTEENLWDMIAYEEFVSRKDF